MLSYTLRCKATQHPIEFHCILFCAPSELCCTPLSCVCILCFLEIYGILYMKKVIEFCEILRNFTELYDMASAEFLRNFEYGIDGSKKTDGIPCRRNSVDTLSVGQTQPDEFQRVIPLPAAALAQWATPGH
jgi:hypothetical protein